MSAGMFSHAAPAHLAGNLMVLAACWPAVAHALGIGRAAALLAAVGTAASAITASLIGRPVIGASGAASAALAAYLVVRRHHGRAVDQSVVAALAWLGSQTIFASLGTAYAGIAWPAHLIGAALGALGAQLLRRRCLSRT